MQRPTRVLHLVTDSIRYDNLALIAEHTDRARFDVTLASVRPPGQLQLDAAQLGVESFSLGASGRSDYPGAVVRLVRELRRREIDVLQTHLLDAQLVGLVAGRIARTRLLVMTAHHSHELPLLGNRLPLIADRLSAGLLAHVVVAPSTWMADTIVHSHHVDRRRIRVVAHGFDVDAWAPSPANRQRLRVELGLEDRTVLGTVGRLHWIKDHAMLVEAFAPIAEEHGDAVLLVVGGGDQAGLRDLASRLGIGDRVVFTGHRFDAPDLFDAIDVYVHAARSESFGLVIAEAMAKGLPVVTTRVGAASDLVDPEGGIVVAPGEPAALRDAIAEAVARRSEWPAMGRWNRERMADYRAPAMVRAYEALYLEGLRDRRRRS